MLIKALVHDVDQAQQVAQLPLHAALISSKVALHSAHDLLELEVDHGEVHLGYRFLRSGCVDGVERREKVGHALHVVARWGRKDVGEQKLLHCSDVLVGGRREQVGNRCCCWGGRRKFGGIKIVGFEQRVRSICSSTVNFCRHIQADFVSSSSSSLRRGRKEEKSEAGRRKRRMNPYLFDDFPLRRSYSSVSLYSRTILASVSDIRSYQAPSQSIHQSQKKTEKKWSGGSDSQIPLPNNRSLPRRTVPLEDIEQEGPNLSPNAWRHSALEDPSLRFRGRQHHLSSSIEPCCPFRCYYRLRRCSRGFRPCNLVSPLQIKEVQVSSSFSKRKKERKVLTESTSKAPTSVSILPSGPESSTSAFLAFSPSTATTLAHFAR